MATDKVDIDGHKVDAEIVDKFFHGDDGKRLTDEEWDEMKRREREIDPDAVTWEPLGEDK